MTILYDKLDSRRIELENRLITPNKELTSAEEADIEYRLRTLHELLDRKPRNKSVRRLTQLLVVMIAAAVLAAGLSIHLAQFEVQLDAETSGLTFTTSSSSAEARLFANPETLVIDSLKITSAIGEIRVNRESTHLVGLIVHPETTIIARADGSGCFSFSVRSRLGTTNSPYGLALTILDTRSSSKVSGNDARLSSPFSLEVAADESLSFCMAGKIKPLLLAGVEALEFWQIYSEIPPRILISTLTEGELRIIETGEELKLGLGDRLSLRSVVNGWFMLTSGDVMGVTFSGTVGEAELVGISPENDRHVLAPTLANYVTQSPKLTWLWGVLLGIVGIIWTVWRFLFSS